MAPGTQARNRRCRLRALLFGAPVVLFSLVALAEADSAGGAVGAAPEGGSCDDVADAQRPLCLMVQACATLPDAAKRAECYEAAADRLGEAEPAPPAAIVPESRPVAARPSRTVSDEPVPEAAPSQDGKRLGTLSAVRKLFADPSRARGPSIPKRFAAKVTSHRDLVRDRQLLVLDGKLLFEGDNAASSAIKVGDPVNVVKASSLRGRRYQITGPSKRQFTALRIRCERTDLNVDNRRKCVGLLGGPVTETN